MAIVCSATAQALFGTTDIIGRQFLARMDASGRSSDNPVHTVTVIGVAEDTDSPEFMSRSTRTVYLPLKQANLPPILAVIGRARTADMAVGGISAAIRAADPDVPIRSIGSGRMVLSGPHAFLRGAAILALSLAGLTLALAMAGLYGIQSHVVAHRTREIGVRMSLGATARQIKVMVLAQGYAPVIQGMVIGAFVGIAGRAIVRSILISRVELVDPWMFLLVPVPLLLAAYCACYFPARRASQVDPNVALRHL